MTTGQFRFAFFPRDYESTVAFYRDGLELPIVGTWDRGPGPGERGTLFTAGSGLIETLALPENRDESVWDYRPPQGVLIVIEVDDVDSHYKSALEKELPIKEELRDQDWGHRSFRVSDPNGITLYFFSVKR